MSNTEGPIRLHQVDGYLERKNDIIYHPPSCPASSGSIIFFGGDMQDYKENMLAHRDNKYYSEWDLESTAALLHQQFPDHDILLIRPAKMALKTFSCYENFVDSNNFGAPNYSFSGDSLKHLKCLLQSLKTSYSSPPIAINDKQIKLIGFSKGCVVLNQFLYSIHSLKTESDLEIESVIQNIRDIYWIDGGHSGSSPTWVTDKIVLETFSKLNISVYIHVTPYQVQCDTRPRIGKEEKIFRDTLIKMDANVIRKLHFEMEPRSLEFHFKVLTCFCES